MGYRTEVFTLCVLLGAFCLYKVESKKFQGENEQNKFAKIPTTADESWRINQTMLVLNGKNPNESVPIRGILQKQQRQIVKYSRKLRFSIKETYENEFAGIYTYRGNYRGAKGVLSVFHPTLSGIDQYTSSILSVESGSGVNLNQIQVGWIVNQQIYNDNEVHLFAIWTRDNLIDTGCYDVQCPGFVVQSGVITLGSVLEASKPNDHVIKEISIELCQDSQTKTWKLFVNGKYLGYWPGNIFSSLENGAEVVKLGGEVLTPPGETDSPQMGTGKFHNGNYYRTAYWKEVSIVDGHFNYVTPDSSFINIAESRCFNVGDASYKPDKGFSSVFGGEGGRPDDCLG